MNTVVSAREAHAPPARGPRGLPNNASAEHEFEAEPGLPEALPRGERLLWRGSPAWRVMARDDTLPTKATKSAVVG